MYSLRDMMVEATINDQIRIDCGDGQVLTVSASDVVEYVRQFGQRRKSCPNPHCDTLWAPDKLASGKWQCPACKKEWE